MKKLLIIMTLFVSSFFFILKEEVKASELTLDITFDNINDTFLEVKTLADELLASNNEYDAYFITYKSGYNVFFFKSASDRQVSCNIYSNDLNCTFYKTYYSYRYSSSSSLISGGTSSNFSLYDYDSKFSNILYSTIPFVQSGGYTTDIITLNYIGNTKQILYEEILPLVYDLYLEINDSGDESPPEELENVTNFYTMIIEKISYLADQVASNYVLLSIIGIFIVIFVFMLIFRRFL